MLPLLSTAQMPMPYTHWFLYGETGAGKTVAASTFERPLFLVPRNENSMVTLRGMDYRYLEVDYHNALPLIAQIRREQTQLGTEWPFRTLVFESLSHYQEFVINALTDDRRHDMTVSHWGKLSNHFQQLHDALRALDMHVVFTALARSELDASKVPTGGPMLSGNTASKLPSACDVIGYCEVERTKRGSVYRIHFVKHGAFIARSRFPRMPAVVENFRFCEIEPYLQP